MRRTLLTGLSTLLLACTSAQESGPALDPEAALAPADQAKPPPPSAWADATTLERGLGHAFDITETWLDPQASAALSLDGAGGVRLWPTLAPTSEDLAALAPISLPLHEAATLSFTRTDQGTFVIAAIDTVQAGRVIEVRIDDQGKAELLELFTIPPSDPLFELHVLEGGERLIALGVDHRLRVYDRSGALLSELSQHGFAPWQLRIAGRGESLHVAAVLAAPTRVQPLELRNGALELVGRAREVHLDRGPNLNDLQLTPDGTKVTAFRRFSAKGQAWSLELIDLASGETRVLWGEVESKIRPRLHIVDDRRALIEDGSGAGYWIDLEGGQIQPPGFVMPSELEALPVETRVETPKIPLAHSIERDRWHASIVAGLRIVPEGRSLVLDPIDDDHFHVLGHAAPDMTGVGFANDGSEVVWSNAGQRLVEPLAQPGQLEPLGESDQGYTWATVHSKRVVDSQGRTYLGSRGRDPTIEISQPSQPSIPTVTMQLHTSVLELILPSPDGRTFAIVETNRTASWDPEPNTVTLSLYIHADPPALPQLAWSINLAGENYDLTWSPTSEALAIIERNVGGMVLTPEGDLLLERRHGPLRYTQASDAEVGNAQAEALRQRQRDERNF